MGRAGSTCRASFRHGAFGGSRGTWSTLNGMDRWNVAVADLTAADEAAVAQAVVMLHAAFPGWLPTREAAAAEVGEALAPARICLAARRGDAVLGWVGAIPAYSHAWELHPLVVRADARGRGIGRALVEALDARLAERGPLTLFLGSDDEGDVPGTSAGGIGLFPDVLGHAARLEVGNHAVGFYRRLGFVVVGLIPDANGPGKPDVLLARRVGASEAPASPQADAEEGAPRMPGERRTTTAPSS